MLTTWKKLPNGTLMPDDKGTVEWLAKIKTGDGVFGDFKRPRNYQLHKKWFVLVNYAFEMWEPGEGMPEKNFERFRQDMTILAGYFDHVPRIDGTIDIVAQSISFAKMTQDTFDALYFATVDAVLKWVLRTYTREDLDHVMKEIARFG